MMVTRAIQENFAILGININEQNCTNRLNGKSAIATIVFCSCVISTGRYFICEAGTIGEYIDSASITSATIIDTFTYLNLLYQFHKFSTFVNSVEKTFQERQAFLESKEIYDENNEKLRKGNRTIDIWMVRLAPAFIVLPKFIASFVGYFTTNAGSDAFELIFPMWFPFDWKKLNGYVGAIAFQYVMAWYFVFLNACIVSFSLGSISTLISFTKDIRANLIAINQSVKDEEHGSDAFDQLSAFIRFHSKTRQLADDYSNIIQPSNMVLFTWCGAQICAKMLILQVEMADDSNSFIMFIGPFSELLWSFGLVWVFCNLCEKLGVAFEEVYGEIELLDWYLFPPKMAKIMPIIIMNAQRRVAVEYFGNVSWCLETFKKVYILKEKMNPINILKYAIVNGGFSYFMICRRFY